jgi:hypothetical protein
MFDLIYNGRNPFISYASHILPSDDGELWLKYVKALLHIKCLHFMKLATH